MKRYKTDVYAMDEDESRFVGVTTDRVRNEVSFNGSIDDHAYLSKAEMIKLTIEKKGEIKSKYRQCVRIEDDTARMLIAEGGYRHSHTAEWDSPADTNIKVTLHVRRPIGRVLPARREGE